MNESIVRRLVELNHTFYETFAGEFSASRAAPSPGFYRLLESIPEERPLKVLDVGSGDGRFGRFLISNGIEIDYTGVDFHSSRPNYSGPFPGHYVARDLSLPNCLDEMGQFDLVVCLATLQHVPGTTNRRRLVRYMAAALKPGGLMFLSNWQFLDSPRQRRKIRSWSEVGLQATDVEQDDFLLTWNRGGFGFRYVSYIGKIETKTMMECAKLRIVSQFSSDGREGDLNLYTIVAVDTP